MSNNLEGSVLCAACGLCCNGTLFSIVPLDKGDDTEVLSALGVKCGRDELQQPCPAYDGQRCRIHSARPSSCRDFDCLVLEAYLRQEIDLAEATAIVDQAHALKKTLFEMLSPIELELSGRSLPSLWREWGDRARGEAGLDFRQMHAPVLMQMATLNWYLEQRFRPGDPDWPNPA